MTSKRNLLIGGVVLLLVCVSVTVVVSSVLLDGLVRVEVHEEGGTNLSLAVPAPLIQLAIRLVPSCVFDDCHDPEAARWLPLAKAACRELGRQADFELVRVESRHEEVSIRIQRGTLHVQVQDRRDFVKIQVPLRLAGSVLDRLEHVLGVEEPSDLAYRGSTP